MQYAHLGRTGVVVSRFCLGTMNFGWKTPEDESLAIMDAAIDQGVNFFDTANVYGFQIGEGITENIVGKWLAQGGRRDRIVLATKVYGPMGFGVNDRGLSALHIRRACDESLRRLKTDRIDVYYMHHIDRGETQPSTRRLWKLPEVQLCRPPHCKLETPWEEIWQAMEVLIAQGKVLYVASSNFAGWHIAQASEKAVQRNMLGLVAEQSLYNLNSRTVELEVLPACREYGMAVVPWSPLAAGLLGGIGDKQASGRRGAATEEIEKHRAKLEAYEAFCRELGERPADVAIAWLLKNPVVTSPILGPRTLDQLTGSLAALGVSLDDAAMGRLDEIFPGPGGKAPEAYAW
ncbi:MAG: aldo/keto reductase [Thermoguttaceae bacterium]